MRRPWAKDGKERAEGAVRRSQLVTTYGAGAMIDLVGSSALVAGLDWWSYLPDERPHIEERRLSAKLVAEMRLRGVLLNPAATLRAPPSCDDDAPDPRAGVQVVEFPRWMACQACNALAQASPSLAKDREGRYQHPCASGRSGLLVPVRFVVVCARGHLDEFPWVEFVHVGTPSTCRSSALVLREEAGGELYDVRVTCQACGTSKSMGEAAQLEAWFRCPGTRPWLGSARDVAERCEEKVKMKVRTSSSTYFAQVVSALSIPDPSAKLERLVRKHMASLAEATREDLEGQLRFNPPLRKELGGFPVDEIWALLEAVRRGETPPQAPLRDAEMRQLLAAPEEQAGDEPDEEERAAQFFARRMRGAPPAGIERIVLVRELREVRAQVGFTRLAPRDTNLDGELDPDVSTAPLGHLTDWLPAVEDHGEGLFLHLDPAAVAAWEARPAVVARAEALARGWRTEHAERPDFLFFGARYYMLHALAHLLIQAIALECGYGASSIRERIYCSPSYAGLLLTTTTAGSDGTLGGLVAQGRRLGDHLARALDLGRLCSNDPVCAAHDPADDHAERHLEGAACHGCLYLAEVSCERMNRMLDRALLVPVIDQDPALAFFDGEA